MFPIALDAFHDAKSGAPESRLPEGDNDFSDALFAAIDQAVGVPAHLATPGDLSGLERLLSFLAGESGGEISEHSGGSVQDERSDPLSSARRESAPFSVGTRVSAVESVDVLYDGEGARAGSDVTNRRAERGPTGEANDALATEQPSGDGSSLERRVTTEPSNATALSGDTSDGSFDVSNRSVDVPARPARESDPSIDSSGRSMGPSVPSVDPSIRSVDDPSVRSVDPSTRSVDSPARSTDPSTRNVNATPAAGAAPHSIDLPRASVDTVDRSMESLHPRLRRRVVRVIERMRSEHGREVELVEGRRTPERQGHLYAQGRTRPGPVVTWTRNSRHLQGQAADLRLDGGSSDRSAYERLQRIAQEEGLRTLGMKDPGHVELPHVELPPQKERGHHGIASVARVARVAQVARPMTARLGAARRRADPASALLAPDNRPFADVAAFDTTETSAVNRPAPGASARVEVPGPANTPERRASEPAETTRGDSHTTSGGRGSSERASLPSEDPERVAPSVRTAKPNTAVRHIESPQSPGGFSEVSASFARSETTSAAPVTERNPVDSMSQVERVLEAREAQRALTPQRVAIRLSGLGRPVDSVRVGLLGSVVEADIGLTDRVGSQQLRTHVADLFRALEGHGLELGSLGLDVGLGRADVMGDPWMGLRSDQTPDVLKALLGGDPSEWLQDDDARERSNARGRQRSNDTNAKTSRDQTNQEEARR